MNDETAVHASVKDHAMRREYEDWQAVVLELSLLGIHADRLNRDGGRLVAALKAWSQSDAVLRRLT